MHRAHSPSQYHPRRSQGYEAPIPRRTLSPLVVRIVDVDVALVARAHWIGGSRVPQRGGALLAIQVVAGLEAVVSRAVPASDSKDAGMQTRGA
jgi:hypothetical protein